MRGDDVEHLEAVLHAAPAGQPLTQHRLGTGVVGVGAKEEVVFEDETAVPPDAGPRHAAASLFDAAVHLAAPRTSGKGRPSGEGPGHLDDVTLRVAAVDTQGVELEELAGIVLVEAPGATLLKAFADLGIQAVPASEASALTGAALTGAALTGAALTSTTMAPRRRRSTSKVTSADSSATERALSR